MECIPDAAKMVASGQSPQEMWITETGYHTGYNTTSSENAAVTHVALGKYVPRILATNFGQKIERTFLYEFYDEYNNDSGEGNFGLIKNAAKGYAEKPSYWHLHWFITRGIVMPAVPIDTAHKSKCRHSC